MQKHFIPSRLGGTALAAALALFATPAFAQEAAPQETPQISVPPEEAAPALTPVPTMMTAPDPLAAQPTVETDATAASTDTGSTAAPVKRAPTKRAASTAAPRTTAAPLARAAPTAGTAPAEVPVIEAPIPVAPLAAAPVPVPAPTPVEAASRDDSTPLALGAGLGLLALGGAAFALRRRRRDDVQDEVIEREPTIRRPSTPARPAPVRAERPVFSWGAPAAVTAAAGQSWVDRAHDGPTPENPFLSLKKRLQRAAFYDQRERAVAAGAARPLSPVAGLPRRFAESMRPRNSAPSYGFAYTPA